MELQVRCRAIENCVNIARASYGTAADVAWRVGMPAGNSCIVDREGTVRADAGRRIGIATHSIDLDERLLKERSFAGQVGDAVKFLRQDRRPQT